MFAWNKQREAPKTQARCQLAFGRRAIHFLFDIALEG
tara:strand:+ start:21777 stop:21887 length:111 start_codon:yes stop_codon:yes gene_type:complete